MTHWTRRYAAGGATALREIADPSGAWRFQPDIYDQGEPAGYFRREHDRRLWREVWVPSCFDACHPVLDQYEGCGWFARQVAIPEDWRDKRVILHFEGVNYHTRVWLNGDKVGHDNCGFLPFEFEVHSHLECGVDNWLVVAADIPGREHGWRNAGGIQREIRLVAIDLAHIKYVTIRAEPREGSGILRLQIQVANEQPGPIDSSVGVEVQDGDGAVRSVGHRA